MSRDAKLSRQLDDIARDSTLPSLVLADESGLLVAAASNSTQSDEVAALSALRAGGDERRSEVAAGRVKARAIDVGGDTVLVGGIGDTHVTRPVFDRVEAMVKDVLQR